MMTEDQIRDFLTTILVPNLKNEAQNIRKTALDYVTAIQPTVDRHGQPTFLVIFEASPERVTFMEGVRRMTEKTLKIDALLTLHQTPPTPKKPAPIEKITLPTVKHIIAVASGKGGVGKSTTAVNLACAFQSMGLKTALLDADIYGPSIPLMMNAVERPTAASDKRIIPLVKHGVTCMSIGFMIPENQPMIWRGPMVMGALQQLLKDVVWGDIDVMVIDMPPGTGDAHLTLAQQVDVSGAVVVSTPQDVALIDARKGFGLFKKMGIPVLGLIENMSLFVCPHCTQETPIFSHGNVKEEAAALEVPFLGEIPIRLEIREAGDKGVPIVVKSPHSVVSQTYIRIAKNIWEQLDTSSTQKVTHDYSAL